MIEHDIDVGRDMEAEKLGVIADVRDDRDVRRAVDGEQPLQEAGSTYATGEDGYQGRKERGARSQGVTFARPRAGG